MIPDKVIEKFHEGLVVNSTDECWPFEGGSYNKKGWHRLISYRGGGVKKNYGAHRVAYELSNGEIPEGLSVLHKCDNPVCCNPGHLFVGTQSDNARDMWSKGRGNVTGEHNIGRKHGPSPHRKFDGPEVIRMYKEGVTQKNIATQFGCSDVAISIFLRKQPEVSHLLGRGGGASENRRHAAKQAVLRLRSEGHTQYKVADMLGVSQAFVSKLENEHGEANAYNA